MEEQNLSNQNNQTSQAGPTLVDMQRFQKKKSRNGKKILVILILAAIISGAVYYFFFFNKNNAEPIAPKNNSNVSETENNIDKNLDSDSDGLPDYMEKVIGTNPNNSDSDGDGYDDLAEIKNGYSPFDDKRYTDEEWEEVKWKIKVADEGFYEKVFGNTIVNSEFTCGTDKVSDIDGNTYNTVQIGSQCWLKENLKVAKNPKGEAIIRYCYDNDPKICETDGGLYDWNTVMNNSTTEGTQGICPTGWHVPKDSEWYVLESGLKDEGEKCDADRNIMWDCDHSGTKLKQGGSSGFEGVIAGFRYNNASYSFRDVSTFFWSSTEENNNNAWFRMLGFFFSSVHRRSLDKTIDYSIRCLKD